MIQLTISAFIDIRLLDIIDILLVAVLLYTFYNILRGTAAINIFIGILAIFLIWKLVDALEMELLSEILGAFISVGFIALIVVFQPEIRRFLLLLGTPNFMNRKKSWPIFKKLSVDGIDNLEVDTLVQACQEMSNSKTGALIVVSKRSDLRQYTESGTILEAKISEELIQNIFYKNSPLHDGAVIVYRNRIIAAACILPLSKSTELPPKFGLRHRAAVGVTEDTDAVAIVVSEQTGKIAFSKSGEILSRISPSKLKELLEEEFNS